MLSVFALDVGCGATHLLGDPADAAGSETDRVVVTVGADSDAWLAYRVNGEDWQRLFEDADEPGLYRFSALMDDRYSLAVPRADDDSFYLNVIHATPREASTLALASTSAGEQPAEEGEIRGRVIGLAPENVYIHSTDGVQHRTDSEGRFVLPSECGRNHDIAVYDGDPSAPSGAAWDTSSGQGWRGLKLLRDVEACDSSNSGVNGSELLIDFSTGVILPERRSIHVPRATRLYIYLRVGSLAIPVGFGEGESAEWFVPADGLLDTDALEIIAYSDDAEIEVNADPRDRQLPQIDFARVAGVENVLPTLYPRPGFSELRMQGPTASAYAIEFHEYEAQRSNYAVISAGWLSGQDRFDFDYPVDVDGWEGRWVINRARGVDWFFHASSTDAPFGASTRAPGSWRGTSRKSGTFN